MGCNCRKCRVEEVITCPTETVVNTRTREKVIKHIHPKEIINVHRTVIKHKHCYPVEERDVYETVVEGNESSSGNQGRGCGCRRRYWGFW